MPIRIPRPTQQLQPVSPKTPQLKPADVGDHGAGAAALAAGFGAAGSVLAARAVDMQNDRNEERVNTAVIELRALARDAGVEALENAIGPNAQGVTKTLADFWSEASASVAAGLESDAQRRLFMPIAVVLQSQDLDVWATHESKELAAALRKSQEAMEGLLVSQAATGAGAGRLQAANENFGAYLDVVNLQIRADGYSLDSDYGKAARLQASTVYHAAVVEALRVNNADLALSYLEAHPGADEIDGPVRTELLNRLDATVDASNTRDAYFKVKDASGSLTEQEAFLRSMDLTPEVFSAALADIRQDYNARQNERMHAEQAADTAGWEAYRDADYNLNDMPPDVLGAMSFAAREVLRDRRRHIVTHYPTFHHLRAMAYGTPEEQDNFFDKTNLFTTWGHLLSEPDLRILVNIQAAGVTARAANASSDDVTEFEGILSPFQVLQGTYRAMGWHDAETFAVQMTAFENELNNIMDAWTKSANERGEPLPTYQDFRGVINRMASVIRWDEDSGFRERAREAPLGEVLSQTDEELFKTWDLDDVPFSSELKIRQTIRNKRAEYYRTTKQPHPLYGAEGTDIPPGHIIRLYLEVLAAQPPGIVGGDPYGRDYWEQHAVFFDAGGRARAENAKKKPTSELAIEAGKLWGYPPIERVPPPLRYLGPDLASALNEVPGDETVERVPGSDLPPALDEAAEQTREIRGRAEQGNAEAQFQLGSTYRLEDVAKAAPWYRKAAEQGHVDAQVELAWLYVGGEGVAQDDVLAYMWFTIAIEQGHVESQGARDRLVSRNRMTPKQIADAQSRASRRDFRNWY